MQFEEAAARGEAPGLPSLSLEYVEMLPRKLKGTLSNPLLPVKSAQDGGLGLFKTMPCNVCVCVSFWDVVQIINITNYYIHLKDL